MWKSRSPWRPMALLFVMATMMDSFMCVGLHGDDAGDVWVWVVVGECEVFVSEVVDVVYVGVECHAWQWSWLSRELGSDLVEVVVVYMCIAEGMDELSGFKSGDLSYHHCEQGV